MNILYIDNKTKFLTYNQYNINIKNSFCIIFHHGLMSNMNGSKAIYLQQFCQKNNYDYIRFDNFGHGNSSGKFQEQTISSWFDGLKILAENLTDKKIILVGSSMGAWITLLHAMHKPDNLAGIVCISSAPDFTKELIWDKLTKTEKNILKTEKIYNFGNPKADCGQTYPIHIDLIKDAQKHLLLDKDIIDINCPVHLIHGMQDIDVPHSIAQRLFAKINSSNMTLKLIKDAHHNLSRKQDLMKISNSINEIAKHNL